MYMMMCTAKNALNCKGAVKLNLIKKIYLLENAARWIRTRATFNSTVKRPRFPHSARRCSKLIKQNKQKKYVKNNFGHFPFEI